MNQNKAVLLVICTAIISGFAIFANKLFVSGADPIVFSALKNLLVGVFIAVGIVVLGKTRVLGKQAKAQWKKLSAISIIGGAVPFALFFYGLSISSAISAGFMHKTIFAAVAVLAALFLGEKIDKAFVGAGVAFFAGLALVFQVNVLAFGLGELLIGIAALFWAMEIIISKSVLEELGTATVLFARMLVGSIILVGIAIVFSGIDAIISTASAAIVPLAITAIMLLGYVATFYHGLKFLPAHKATAILLLATPITAVLATTGTTPMALAGNIIILAGISVLLFAKKPVQKGVWVAGN